MAWINSNRQNLDPYNNDYRLEDHSKIKTRHNNRNHSKLLFIAALKTQLIRITIQKNTETPCFSHGITPRSDSMTRERLRLSLSANSARAHKTVTTNQPHTLPNPDAEIQHTPINLLHKFTHPNLQTMQWIPKKQTTVNQSTNTFKYNYQIEKQVPHRQSLYHHHDQNPRNQ